MRENDRIECADDADVRISDDAFDDFVGGGEITYG